MNSMVFYAALIQVWGVLALLSVATALGLFVALALPSGRAALATRFAGQERHPIGWAWFVALVATTGSLYLSDVVGFAPCMLCWYQRIAMYPLVLVLGVGLLRGDPGVWRYALPLPVAGFLISGYHALLQFRPALEVVQCTTGVPCTARYMRVFGFISIPWLAGACFLIIIALLLLVRNAGRGRRDVEVGDEARGPERDLI